MIKIKLSNITTTEKFYNLNEMIERDEKLLNRIIDVEIKRYKIYSKRSPNSKFDAKQQQLLTNLEESLKRHDALQGIYTFLETMYISNRIKLPLKGILLIGY